MQKAPGENYSFLPGALIVSKIDSGTKPYLAADLIIPPAPQPQLPLQGERKLSYGTCRSARNEGCRL